MGKRKLFSTAVFIIALSAMLLLPLAASADDGTTMVVYAPLGLRLRAGASLSDAVLLVLYNGEQVTVFGDPVWNQGIRWSNVEVTRWGVTTTGWAASAYLASYPGYEEPRDHFTGEAGCKVTATAGLRLRTAPTLSGTISHIVPYGTILVPTGEADVVADGYTWTNLYTNGTSVWAANAYLECW